MLNAGKKLYKLRNTGIGIKCQILIQINFNPQLQDASDLNAPVVKVTDLYTFRTNKIVTFANNDFSNITGPAINIASEDAESGVLIRPQMINSFDASNFVGDPILSINSHPEWIGDSFVRIENQTATYIGQINKINGELINYRQRLVLNSTLLNSRLADAFIMSGPYDGNYYRLGINSDNKLSVVVSDTQATVNEIVYANNTAIKQGDAKADPTQLSTLKIVFAGLNADSAGTIIYYTELDLLNPSKLAEPIALITLDNEFKLVESLVWSEIGKSFILMTVDATQYQFNYYQIADSKATLTTSFTEKAENMDSKTFSFNTFLYSQSAKPTQITAVEFLGGVATPRQTTYDLSPYNISSITSIKPIDVATFAILCKNSQVSQDNNWLVVLKTGSLAAGEAAIHSVMAVGKNIKSTLSVPTTGYSKSDLALVGLLDQNYLASFDDKTLSYMEMWRQGPHVVFDVSGVSTSQAFTVFAYNVSYWATTGEIKTTRYASTLQFVDPAPLSAIPKINKVPMMDGKSYVLSDLVSINGYTSDISLRNTANAFIVPAWPQAKDFLSIRATTGLSSVQGSYIFYEDQAEGLKLTQLNDQNNLIKTPAKCAPQKVGTIDPENSGFAVFYALCKDIDQPVATQSLFVVFVDIGKNQAYTTRYYLQTNSIGGLALPTLKLSSPGSLTAAFVARIAQGANSGLLLGRFTLNPQVAASSTLQTQFFAQTEGWAASNLFDALVLDDGSTISIFYAPAYSSKLTVRSFAIKAQGIFAPTGDQSKIPFGADFQYHEDSRLSCAWQQGSSSSGGASCAISGSALNSFYIKVNLDGTAKSWTQTGLATSQNVPGLNYSSVAWDGSMALLSGFNTGYKPTGAAYTSSRFWMQIVVPDSTENSLQAVIATNDGSFKPAFYVAPNGSKMVFPGVSLNGNITTLIPQPTKIQIANARQLSSESGSAVFNFRDLGGKTAAPVVLASVFFYVAPTPDQPKPNGFSKLLWIMIAVGATVILGILIAFIIYYVKRKSPKAAGDQGDAYTTAPLKQGDSNLGSIMIRDSTMKDSTLLKD